VAENVEIPKRDGGVRKLGIPTVLDRLIQQAVMPVLQRSWDPTFFESSYGFRPGRSAHQAVARAQQHIAAGHRWVDSARFGIVPRLLTSPSGSANRRGTRLGMDIQP
jgi:hypothetical protein